MKNFVAALAAGAASAALVVPTAPADAAGWNNVADSYSHTKGVITVHSYVRTKTTASYITYYGGSPIYTTDWGHCLGYELRLWNAGTGAWLSDSGWQPFYQSDQGDYTQPEPEKPLAGYWGAGLKFQDGDMAVCSSTSTQDVSYFGHMYY